MDKRIISVLQHGGIEVDIAIFNIDTGSAAVDGSTAVDQAELGIVPTSKWRPEIISQVWIDRMVHAHCNLLPRNHACRFRAHSDSNSSLQKRMTRNALRQLFSERQVGRFLRSQAHVYDVAIVVCADFYLALNVSLTDARRAAQSARAVYTSAMGDMLAHIGFPTPGFIDGFYIGAPLPTATILSRLDDDELWHLPGPHSYEVHLKQAFDLHGLERRPTSMHFFKVRANGWVHWQPYLSLSRHAQLLQRTLVHESDRQQVLGAWRETSKYARLKQKLE